MKDFVDLTALPWNREEVGICSEDFEQIGSDQAKWVDVKYNGKKIAAILREVHRGSDWPKNLHPIYIQEARWKEELQFPNIRGHDAISPSTVTLKVSKRRFPPIKAIWPALVIFAILLIGAIFGALYEMKLPQLANYTIHLGLIVLAVTVFGLALQAYGIYKQMQ